MNDRLGNPGEFPYTRGVYREMYRSRLWTMRQYAGFGSAEASNQRYRYLLSQGTTGLSVAFDLPTQMGYDSHQRSPPRPLEGQPGALGALNPPPQRGNRRAPPGGGGGGGPPGVAISPLA